MGDDQPQLSVVTVSYNCRDDLEKTILNVAAQRFEDYEYIVVDGGSDDGSLELLQENSQHVSQWLSEPDEGIYDAMNKAINLANGRWTIFLNAGDEFANVDVLSKFMSEESEDIDFLYGDRYRVETDGEIEYQRAGDLRDMLKREVVYHQALFNCTSRLKQRGYNRSYALAADYEYVVHAWSNGAKFKHVPAAVCVFRCGGKSRVQHIKAMVEAMKVSIDHEPDVTRWNRSDFFRNFIGNHIEYFITSHLNDYLGKSPNASLKLIKNENNRLQIRTSPDDVELNRVFDRITRPVSLLSHALSYEGWSSGKTSSKVTVATVVFNDAAGLEKTIHSVTGQSYENIEFIVIDGASTDGTQDTCRQYAAKIDVLVSEPDTGIYNAMNKAIEKASGDYVIFMNAGDTFVDSSTVAGVFAKADLSADVLYGDRYYLKADGSSSHQAAKSIDTVFHRMPYCHQSCFTKLSVLQKFRFDETYRYAADYNQVVQMYTNGCSFSKLDVTVCNFLEGGRSESGIRPYLEVIKIQLDNVESGDALKNSEYINAFQRNFQNLINGIYD